MPTDSSIDARVAWVIPLRTIDIQEKETKRSRLARFSAWRRTSRGEGTISLAELGRETGARC